MEKIDKQLLKDIMLGYLQRRGYPNMTNDMIMQELPSMFTILLSRGLIPVQMDYQLFYKIALRKYMEFEG